MLRSYRQAHALWGRFVISLIHLPTPKYCIYGVFLFLPLLDFRKIWGGKIYICAISEDPDDMISASCDVLLKVCNVYRLFNNITATRVATYNLRQCRFEYVFA